MSNAYPSTDTVAMKVGQIIKLPLVALTKCCPPMHVHGGPFEVVALTGVNLDDMRESGEQHQWPGQRYSVVWTARKPGNCSSIAIFCIRANENVRTKG